MIEPKIKPFRSLQTTTITFGIVVTLIFGFWLVMASNDRVNNFVKYHQIISKNATRNISQEIERLLLQKRQLVQSFVEDNRAIFDDITAQPENEELFDRLNLKLGRYFSDYFSSNIATTGGELVVDDFEGDIGELCLTDLKQYVRSGYQQVRIHPNQKIYHYDILVEFGEGMARKIIIITFSADEIAGLLKASNPENHNLLIVDRVNNLIEITRDGSRIMLKNRLDYRLSEDEEARVISSASIQGSYWNVIDIHDENLFSDFQNKTLRQGLIVYLFFILMAALMSFSLHAGVRRQNKLEQGLLENNREISALNTELEKLSLTDSLTGLYNRRHFEANAGVEFCKTVRLGVDLNLAIIDIDYFKQYNDRFGHQAGDECLVRIADILKNNFRRSSEAVTRYGGEEFIILNQGDDYTNFLKRLEQLSAIIEESRIENPGSKVSDYITISTGVGSTVNIYCESVEELISAADRALYLAKGEGRNRVMEFKESNVNRFRANN
ncbi:MAG: GGDEF domain-containing protein [Gammaproteobacteria bacterium]|nr:GGDEF domain-containing protein [Gammaproteobacteria bacterium]